MTNRSFDLGLVSVTFRPLSRTRVVETMRQAGLSLVEWGGDVHVPSGDPAAIEEAVELGQKEGVRTVSYGSYYRCGDAPALRTQTIACAARLGAENVRVWAGTRGSGETDPAERARICARLQAACDEAAPFGMTVSVEFHGGTLTDEYPSAVRLWEEVARENFRLYWQPNQFRDDGYNCAALRAVLPMLSNVHVFAWRGNGRYPLAEGEQSWRKYLDILRTSPARHALLLEFVCDDTPAQLIRDAETLRRWLEA